MPDFNAMELLIIAVIVLLLFGPGKAADLGGSLGKSIREFRKATQEEDKPQATEPPMLKSTASPSDAQAPAGAASTDAAPTGTGGRFCAECGSKANEGQKFCMNCGKALAA
jgi:sec-independent protein translocase protein TatA